MPGSSNIARHLDLMAANQPLRPAVKIAKRNTGNGGINYLVLNFSELKSEVDAWQCRLNDKGVRKGDRTLVMVRQGLPLIASVFALFRIGAVPVIIDPGMGLKSFSRCVAHTKPRVLVGILPAQLLSHFSRFAFSSVEVRITASGKNSARLNPAAKIRPRREGTVLSTEASELAAILFTSGSTGAPKGVCYTHGMFEAQVEMVRQTYQIEPGEIDLPMLPIFALFNPALGMTTIVPDLNPGKPAAMDPRKIVQAIIQENVTNSFGSPRLWRKIADHCLSKNIQLPSLKRVLMAGAPVPARLFSDLKTILPNGEAYSPYGATEALPLSSISATETDKLSKSDSTSFSPPAAGRGGTCVGFPVQGVTIKIIAAVDGPIPNLSPAIEMPPGQIGEIIARGPNVTQCYFDLPQADTLSKIADPFEGKTTNRANDTGGIWHRMGDVGYIDEAGRVWFCGRKVERVLSAKGWNYTEQCEPIFSTHPEVQRCALIGVQTEFGTEPAIVIESVISDRSSRKRLAGALRKLALENPATQDIHIFFFHPKFPMDVRHNAKIHRLTLTQWAASEVPEIVA